ncbi:ccnk, partial [Symbiodinium microadriaticum]
VLKELRESILVAERIVLHTLCFDFQLEHPIGLCVLKVKTDLKSYVPDDRKVELVNTALNFLRDSNGTLLSLLYNANKIALGAIFMATLQLGISPLQPRAGLTTMSRLHSAGLSWFDLIKNDIDVDSLK